MVNFNNSDEAKELLGIPGMQPSGFSDTEIVPIDPIVLKDIESNLDLVSEDFKSDYELVRQSYHFQQQMMLDAAQLALQNAKTDSAPRQMEVFSTLMSTWSTINKELLKMHKDIKDIKSKQDPTESLPNTNTTINNTHNNVMVGTPLDVLEELGSQFDQQLKKQHTDEDIIEHEEK